MQLFLRKVLQKKHLTAELKKLVRKKDLLNKKNIFKILGMIGGLRNANLKKQFLKFNEKEKPRFEKVLKGFLKVEDKKKKEGLIKPSGTMPLFLNLELRKMKSYPSYRTPALILKTNQQLDVVVNNKRQTLKPDPFQRRLLELFQVHQKKPYVLLSKDSEIIQRLLGNQLTTEIKPRLPWQPAKVLLFSAPQRGSSENKEITELKKKAGEKKLKNRKKKKQKLMVPQK